MPIRDFVHALPKAELHLHFEGAIPWSMVRARSPVALPERPAWWAEGFRFDDFDHFRREAHACLGCLTDVPAYATAAAAIFHGLRAQNVRYVEISLDVMRLAEQPVGFAEVLAVIKAAAPPGLTVRLVGGFSYHKHDRTPDGVIEAVLGSPAVDGIDLHGDERRESTARFADVFAEARRRGLLTKAHAGELVGPRSVARALDLLGVKRIEHGVRAVEDAALVDRLAAEAVTLDVCPWSNVRLGIVRDLAGHPIRRLHERGVRMTIGTDDPTVFGRPLEAELASLVDDLGFSPAAVARFQADAFAVAAMPAAAREAALREIDALVAGYASGRA
jgi:adenosine deaminase